MKKPVINNAWCKGCGMCADSCPKTVFEHRYLNAVPTVSQPNDCVACGVCELKCPDFALTLFEVDVAPHPETHTINQ
jgi:2-oxoglutarate ferredoxin oxidoreductase subunit delta